jgi:hypothetical protein|tara:strand:- start:415 stop:870 length:456 start_codon:yes stop_codon:yes gene_type:complete
MSTILVNTLTGTTTAGSIAVTGEGNSTTTNLQQGLAKAWVNFDGTGTIASRDSLNVSGLTDNATGHYTVTVSSAMANNDFAVTTTGFTEIAAGRVGLFAGLRTNNLSADTPSIYFTTTSIQMGSGYASSGASNGALSDSDTLCADIKGDLA